MSLSILIPIYNNDVRPLVQRLHEQAQALTIAYEIYLLDDASSPDYQLINKELALLPNVRYESLSANVGRARIRNLLAKGARYDFLQFMDCDMMPYYGDFLSRYAQRLHPERLLYGGCCYSAQAPAAPQLYFHWFYGSHREQRSVQDRQQNAHRSFMTGNFVIPKQLMLSVPFDETLTGYGHEDTLFGWQLTQQSVTIEHLDNPMEHLGIETTERFLHKTRQAVENLYFLYQKYRFPAQEVKLLRYFEKTRRWRIQWLVLLVFKLFHRLFIRNFHSRRPRLRWFDVYKLGYLIQYSVKN